VCNERLSTSQRHSDLDLIAAGQRGTSMLQRYRKYHNRAFTTRAEKGRKTEREEALAAIAQGPGGPLEIQSFR
jgi:hypothetical protein